MIAEHFNNYQTVFSNFENKYKLFSGTITNQNKNKLNNLNHLQNKSKAVKLDHKFLESSSPYIKQSGSGNANLILSHHKILKIPRLPSRFDTIDKEKNKGKDISLDLCSVKSRNQNSLNKIELSETKAFSERTTYTNVFKSSLSHITVPGIANIKKQNLTICNSHADNEQKFSLKENSEQSRLVAFQKRSSRLKERTMIKICGENVIKKLKYDTDNKKDERPISNDLKTNSEAKNSLLNVINKYHRNSMGNQNDFLRVSSPSQRILIHPWEFSKKEEDYKNRIVEEYLNKHKNKFYTHDKARNIYAILDGTVVLNHEMIPGRYIDIPTRKVLMGKSFEERKEIFHEFLSYLGSKFQQQKSFKSVVTKDKTIIEDLLDIQENDLYIIVSLSNTLVGLSLVYKFKKFSRGMRITRYRKSNGNNSSSFNLAPQQHDMNKKRINLNLSKQNFTNQFAKYKKITKMKKKKNNCSSTFAETIDEEEWLYFSDNEKRKKDTETFLSVNYDSFNRIFSYFNQYYIDTKTKHYQSKLKELENQKEKYVCPFDKEKLPSMNFSGDIMGIIDKYNFLFQKRQKKFEDQMKIKSMIHTTNQKSKKNKDKENINKYFNQLEVLRNYSHEFLIQFKSKQTLKFIQKNIKEVENVYFHLDREANKYYPCLTFFNIPRLLQSYKKFNREDLYDLFTQYKTLIKLCMALNKTFTIAGKGIDFKTFWRGNYQMSLENADIIEQIFHGINLSESKYLALTDYLKGMALLKSHEMSEKIDMFFKIIDKDGNGLLSFDEVYDISLMSLKRSVQINTQEANEVVNELAYYFAKLIFALVEVDVNEEIPLGVVREKITSGLGNEVKYLEMFCCSDNFKSPSQS